MPDPRKPAAKPLPVWVKVESRGLGEHRHVLLDLDGTQFELHPLDARAIGQELVRIADQVAKKEGA